MPTDAVRRPLELMVYLAPRGPMDKPTEFLLKLRRRPGAIFSVRRKRSPIGQS